MFYRRYARKSRFSRRRGSSRNSFRRTGRPSRMAFAKGTARYSRPIARFNRMLNRVAEKKVLQSVETTSSVSSSGLTAQPLFPVQGVQKGQRVGNKIFIRYWKVKMILSANATNNYVIRFALVWPKRRDFAIGDFPTSTQIQNWDLDKFTVLWDRTLTFGGVNTDGQYNLGVPTTRVLDKTIRIMKSFNFDDNVSSPQETFPVLFWWANDAVTPYPQLSIQSNTTFTDV